LARRITAIPVESMKVQRARSIRVVSGPIRSIPLLQLAGDREVELTLDLDREHVRSKPTFAEVQDAHGPPRLRRARR
jgi:hypothetical protein